MSETEPMAYAGTCEACGSLCAASVDTPDHKRENAKFVAQMIRDGLRVERVTCEFVRQTLATCKCKPTPQRRKPEQGAKQEALGLGAA